MYKVGDKVRVKNNLVVGERYGSEIVITEMRALSGKKVTINTKLSNGKYFIKELDFCWTNEMLEPIKEEEEMKIYKIDELIEGVEYKGAGSGEKYKICCDNLYLKEGNDWEKVILSYLEFKGMGFVECEFEPKGLEKFFYPQIVSEDGVSQMSWTGGRVDHRIKRAVGVYRTWEQAQEKARELGWAE